MSEAKKEESLTSEWGRWFLLILVIYEGLRLWAVSWAIFYTDNPAAAKAIQDHLADPEKPSQFALFLGLALLMSFVYWALAGVPLTLVMLKKKWAAYFFIPFFFLTFAYVPDPEGVPFPFHSRSMALVWSIFAVIMIREKNKPVTASTKDVVTAIKTSFDPSQPEHKTSDK